ncbi:unnamed protein product [Debaryomyces fabryi]|nr:unnamed protein product [Debaryomyces fabryi]
MVSKFFGIEKNSNVDMVPLKGKLYFDDNADKWKELFIFLCVIPFIEYEFQGNDGNLLNPDTLHNACPSHATDNLLIGTFSDIEFELLCIL